MGVYTRICFEKGVFTCIVWQNSNRIVKILFRCVWVCICVRALVYAVFYRAGLGGSSIYHNFRVLWDVSGYMGCGRCFYWPNSFFAGLI